MVLNVKVNYPKDMEVLESKAAEVLTNILIKKLQPKEVDELIELMQKDKVVINW